MWSALGLLVTFIIMVFVFPIYIGWWNIAYIILFVATMIMMVKATFEDPGIIPRIVRVC